MVDALRLYLSETCLYRGRLRRRCFQVSRVGVTMLNAFYAMQSPSVCDQAWVEAGRAPPEIAKEPVQPSINIPNMSHFAFRGGQTRSRLTELAGRTMTLRRIRYGWSNFVVIDLRLAFRWRSSQVYGGVFSAATGHAYSTAGRGI